MVKKLENIGHLAFIVAKPYFSKLSLSIILMDSASSVSCFEATSSMPKLLYVPKSRFRSMSQGAEAATRVSPVVQYLRTTEAICGYLLSNVLKFGLA